MQRAFLANSPMVPTVNGFAFSATIDCTLSQSSRSIIGSCVPSTLYHSSLGLGLFISVKKLEQAVISELNKLSQEYLDKDELEQNVEFHSNVKEKKTALETQLATYQKKIEEDAKNPFYFIKIKFSDYLFVFFNLFLISSKLCL